MTLRRKNAPKINPRIFGGQPTVPASRQLDKNMPTFGNQKLGRNFNGYIPGIHHPEYFPARNQSNLELISNSFGQLVGEAIFGISESVGYVLDLSAWMENWAKPGSDFENFVKMLEHPQNPLSIVDQLGEGLSDISRVARESTKESWLPIYDTPQSHTIGNRRWFAQNIPSLGTFVGLLVPGMAAAKGASAVAKLIAGGKGLSRTGQFLVSGIGGATVSRHAEGMMEGMAQYDQMVRMGYTEEEAAAVASKVYRDNAALFFVDFMQFGYLMRPGSKIMRRLFSRNKDKLPRGQRLTNYGVQMGGEAFEEGYQFMAGKEAEAMLEGADPRFIFAEGFLGRLDNYFNDTELYTSMMLGALGGAVAPVVMKRFNKLFKSPPEESQEYLERLRAEVGEMLTSEEHEYLDGKQFLGSAMRFASQGRMSDMQDILEGYIEEFENDPEKAASVARAKEALEMMPQFEEIFNKEQNRPAYARGGEDKAHGFEHIKNPAAHIRAIRVGEQFMAKMDQKLQGHYDKEYSAAMGEAVGFDRRYEELYKRKALMEYANQKTKMFAEMGVEIPQEWLDLEEQYEKSYQEEVSRLEAEEISVSDLDAVLTTTQDQTLKPIIVKQALHQEHTNERIDLLKQLQTEEGQRKYLQEYDTARGARRENWLKRYGAYLGEGTKVGNEMSQFTVRQMKEPDRLALERTDQLKAHAPVSNEERRLFEKDGTVSPERRIAIANKKATGKALNKVESEMYNKHKEEIEKLRETNLDNNNGQGYSHEDLMSHMWDNGMEILDVHAYEVAMDERIIAAEQSRLKGMREDVLGKLQRLAGRIQAEERHVNDNPGVETDTLEALREELKQLEAQFEDINEEYDNIEKHPDLYRNHVKLRRQILEEEDEDLTYDEIPLTGDRTIAQEEGPHKYAVDVYRTMYGSHRKRGPDGKHIDEVTESQSQARFFKWVDSNPVHDQKLHLKLYPIVDGNGEVIADSLNMFIPEGDPIREGKSEEQLAEILRDALFGVVVNEEGKPIGIDGKGITETQIPALGLFSSLIEPNLQSGMHRVIHNEKELGLIENEYRRYRANHQRIMDILRGTENKKAQDVFLPIKGKSMGVPIDTGQEIPIAHISQNPTRARIIVSLDRPVMHQGRNIQFDMGAAYLRDNTNKTVTKANRRKLVGDEIETVYQLIQFGASTKDGFLGRLPKRRITTKDALKHYIHWMAPTRKGKGNKGGIIYDKMIDGKLYLYLEGFDGTTTGENLYLFEELTEADLKTWIGTKEFNVNQKYLDTAVKNDAYKYIAWTKDRQEFRWRNPTKQKGSAPGKGWRTYSEFLMDPKQGILTSTLPAYTANDQQPQRWNSNLLYDYENIGEGKPTDKKSTIPRPGPSKKKGSRQGVAESVRKKFERADSQTGLLGRAIRMMERVERRMAEAERRMGIESSKGKSDLSSPWKGGKKSGKKGGKKSGKRKKRDVVVEVITGTSVEDLVPTEGFKQWYKEWLEESGSEDTPTNFRKGMGFYEILYGPSTVTESKAPQEAESETIDEMEDDSFTEDKPTKEDVSDVESLFRDLSGEDDVTIDRGIDVAQGQHYIREDLEAAEAWFKERFPQVPFYIVANLMKQGAMGRFTEWGEVLLDQAAQVGTIYHEAFHATSFMFLTDFERAAIYDEYRRKYGKKGMSLRQIEEGLAEMFRDYVLTGTLPESKPIKGFFQKLLNFMRSLFGQQDLILRTYERINNGYYAHMKPNTSRKFQYHDREIQFALPDSDVQYTKEAIGHMHILFLDEIRKRNLQTSIVDGTINLKELRDIYDAVNGRLNNNVEYWANVLEKRFNVIKRERALGTESKWSPMQFRLGVEMLQEIKNNMRKQYETLQYYYENPEGKSWLQLHAQHLSSLNINIEEDLVDELSAMTDPDQLIASQANQRSQFMTASSEVRFWLSGVQDLRKNKKGEDVAQFTPHGYYKAIPNVFGLIAKTLAGTTQIEEQVERLHELQQDFLGLKHVFRDFSLERPNQSSNIQDLEGSAFMRRSKFFQALARYYENYHGEPLDPAKPPHRVPTNSATLRRQILTSWKRAYKGNLSENIEEKLNDGIGLTFDDVMAVARSIGMDLSGIAAKEGDVYLLPIDLQEIVTKKLEFIARNIFRQPSFNPYEGDTGDVSQIIKIEMRRRPEYSEASHINPGGNSVYDILDYNYYYYTVARLNNIADEINRRSQQSPMTIDQGRQIIYGQMPHFKHAYYRTSQILDHIAQGNKITTSLEEGVNGKEYNKLRKPDRFTKEVLDLTRGVYHLIRPADNSLERVFSLASDEFGDGTRLFMEESVSMEMSDIIEHLQQFLMDELAMIDEVNNNKSITYSNWLNFTKNMRSDPASSGMLMSMFSEEFGVKIMTFLNSTGDLEQRQLAFVKDPEVVHRMISSVNYLVETQIQPMIANYRLQELGLLDEAFEGLPAISVARFVAMNYLISAIEQTKLLTGHPSQFEDLDNLVKRMSGMVGPKTLAMTDERTNEYLQTHFNARGGGLKIAVTADPIVTGASVIKPKYGYMYATPHVNSEIGIMSDQPADNNHRVLEFGRKGQSVAWMTYNKRGKMVSIDGNVTSDMERAMIILAGQYLNMQELTLRADIAGNSVFGTLDNVTKTNKGYKYEAMSHMPLTREQVYNAYEEALKERFGDDYGAAKADLYAAIVESDAHGFWDMHAYREFLVRNAAWGHRQEMAWHWQMQRGWQGETVTIPKNNPFAEIAGKTVTRDMVEKNGHILVSTKPQGFGPWSGNHMMTMLKFAATPLLPELVHGTALEDLARKMAKEKVGMDIMGTGTKVGIRTADDGEPLALYDDTGKINSEPFVVEELGWEFIGIQVQNSPDMKSVVSPGTQKDRQIEADLYVYGIPIDFATSFKQEFEAVSFEKALKPILIENFPEYTNEPFYLTELDLETGKGAQFKYDNISLAYEEQLAILDDAKQALKGTLNADEYQLLLGEIGMPQEALGLQLLNDALYNISKIRSRLRMDRVLVAPIRDQIVPRANFSPDAIDHAAAREAWDALTEEEKLRKSGIYQSIEKLRRLEASNIDYGLMLAKEKLGLDEVLDEEGNFQGYTVNLEKIRHAKNWLAREMGKRAKIPTNMVESIQWLEYGTDAMVSSQEVEILLKSMITNSSINRKVHGKSMVLVPSTMQEIRRMPYYSDGDATYYKGSDLKTYEDDQGRITSMEVYMPHYFKELYGEKINIDEVDSRLLEIIGFRIPTQALSSLESIKIKDFLPIGAGDIVIVPSELVTKTGADFDWDKLYVHLPNYDVVDGIPLYSEYEEVDMNKLWKRRKRGFAMEFAPDDVIAIHEKYSETGESSIILSAEDFDERMRANLMGGSREMESERKEKIAQEMDALYDELRKTWDTLPLDQKNGHKRMDNLKLELQHQMIKMPARFGSLVSPITASAGTSVLKDAGLKLLEQRDKKKRELMGELPYNLHRIMQSGLFQLGNLTFMLEKGYQLQTAKQNISTGALTSTAHINFSQVNVYLDNVVTHVPTNTINVRDYNHVSLAGLKDADNQYYISDLLNELITAYADSPSDPFIHDIGGAGENAMVFATMIIMGVPIDYIVAFMNQPLIQQYNDKLDLQKSGYFSVTRDAEGSEYEGSESMTTNFIKEYRSKYGVQQDVSSIQTVSRLQKQAAFPYILDTDGNPMFREQWDHTVQFTALNEYLRLKEIGSELFRHISASTYNTKHGGKNVLSAMLLVEGTDSLIKRPADEMQFVNYQKLFEGNGYLAPHRRAVKETIEMLTPFHAFMSNGSIREILDDLMHKMVTAQEGNTVEDNVNLLDRFRNELSTAIYQVYFHENGNVWDTHRDLIMTYPKNFNNKTPNDTVPRRVLRMKNEMKAGERKENYLIMNLVPHLKNKTAVARLFTDNMSLQTISGRKANAQETERFTDAWRELYDMESQLAKDIFVFLMMQSGMSPSPNNFMRIVPHELFAEDSEVGMLKKLFRFSPNQYIGAKTSHDMLWFYEQFALNNRDKRVFRWGGRRSADSFTWPFIQKHSGGHRYYFVGGKKLPVGLEMIDVKGKKKKQKALTWKGFPFTDYTNFASAKRYSKGDQVVLQKEKKETTEHKVAVKTKPKRTRRTKLMDTMAGTPKPIITLISDGQTGAGQIGLRAAKDAGMLTGGMAPKGFYTETGENTELRDVYGLEESTEKGYTAQIKENVIKGDATVLFGDMESPEYKQTLRFLKEAGKPYITKPTAEQLEAFIQEHKVSVLNVAGNRASKLTKSQQENIYNTVYQALLRCK